MSKAMSILRAIFMPQPVARHEPADLLAFKEASGRMHESVKRLSKAVEHDQLGAMIKRMQGNGARHTKRQRKK